MHRTQPPAPPPAAARPPKTPRATEKSNPPTQRRHYRGGGTPGNPTPKKCPGNLPAPTPAKKPAGAPAKPAEPEPNPTRWANSPCVYITATRSASQLATPFTDQCMHRPRKCRRRKRQPPPPEKKPAGRGETPPTFEQEAARPSQRARSAQLGQTSQPWGGKGKQDR